MSTAIAANLKFATITCGACGIVFAVPDHWKKMRLEDHDTWYCPNGHGRCFSAKSEAELLRELLAQQKAQKERLEWERDRAQKALAAAEKKAKATRRRVGNGVCPCCHRTVSQLARHMKSKHPDYAEPVA